MGGSAGARAAEVSVAPPVDVYEDEHGLVVVADLRGGSRDALDVRVEAGVHGFFREFQLPEVVNSEAIVAESRHGVLTLRLPQKVEPTRKIEVQVSAS